MTSQKSDLNSLIGWLLLSDSNPTISEWQNQFINPYCLSILHSIYVTQDLENLVIDLHESFSKRKKFIPWLPTKKENHQSKNKKP